MAAKFLQTLIDALAVGSLYALIALGYTMVYGILKFINFAHSDVFVLGAWVSLAAAVASGFGSGSADVAMPLWVMWFLWGSTGLAAIAIVVEAGSAARRGGIRTFRLRESRFAAILILISCWGWTALGLASMARASVSWGGMFMPGLFILLCAMTTCGLVGFLIERLAYKPLRGAPRLNVLITAIGVSLLLQNLGQLEVVFGTRPRPMPALLPKTEPLFTIGSGEDPNQFVNIWPVDALGAGTAIVLMFILDWLVHRTSLGRAMRAVSFSPTTASLMGINVDRIMSITFVIGAVLAAAAGFLYGQKYPGLNQPAAATWVLLGLKAFVAAVVGGIGNIRGAMLGGILIGLLEFFGAAYISAAMRDVYVFSLLILVLLVRPSGLLGKAEAEKV